MESGRCPACARSFTAGEVTGFGILRPRPARSGGPFVEFACPGCGRGMRLIPHGDGRYAHPGEPPPPTPPASTRVPPWVSARDRAAGARGESTRRTAHRPEEAEEPEPIEIPVPEVEEAPPRDEDGEAQMTAAQALEVLGLQPTAEADDIERAYRERSRSCHPDKVAHLDREFHELAERKFKALRRAYEILTS